jgi:hypothetical protein
MLEMMRALQFHKHVLLITIHRVVLSLTLDTFVFSYFQAVFLPYKLSVVKFYRIHSIHPILKEEI